MSLAPTKYEIVNVLGFLCVYMFAILCNKLDIHEPLIQNIFVCVNTQYMCTEITVYMNHI